MWYVLLCVSSSHSRTGTGKVPQLGLEFRLGAWQAVTPSCTPEEPSWERTLEGVPGGSEEKVALGKQPEVVV